MTRVGEVTTVFRGDTRDLERAVQRSGKAVDGFGKKVKGVAGSLGIGLGVGAGIAAFEGLARSVTRAAQAFGEFSRRGTEVAGVSNAFQKLSSDYQAILASSRQATQGMVSDFDLMAAANKGILLGLPITAKEMAILGRTAVSLGKAMKVGPTQAMEDLITGLGRGSPMILDNLGITVKAADAYDKYAASIGKSAGNLTDSEKKLAIYKSAMSAATAQVEKMGEAQLTTGDRMSQFTAKAENLYDELARMTSESEALGTVLAGALKVLTDLEPVVLNLGAGFGALAEKMKEFAEGVAPALQGLEKSGVMSGAKKAAAGSIAVLFPELAGTLSAAAGMYQLGAHARSQPKVDPAAAAKLAADIAKAGQALGEMGTTPLNPLETLNSKLQETKYRIWDLTEAVKAAKDFRPDLIPVSAGLGGMAGSMPGLAMPTYDDQTSVILNEKSMRDAVKRMKEIDGLTKRTEKKTVEWHDALADVANQFSVLGNAPGLLGRIGDLMSRVAGAASSFGASMETFSAGKKAGGFTGLLGMVSGAAGIVGAVSSIGGMLGGLFGGDKGPSKHDIIRKQYQENLEKFQSQAPALQSQGTAQAAGAMTAWLSGISTNTEKAATTQASIFAATFNAVLKEKGLAAALATMEEPFKILQERLEALGMEDLLGDMGEWFKSFGDESVRGIVEAMGALNQVMTGAAAGGWMDVDLFGDFMSAAVQAYEDALAKLGDTGDPAMALKSIAPTLANIIRLAEMFGLTIDDATQELIDMAKAAGISFPTADPVSQLVDALGELMDVLRQIHGIPPPDWGAWVPPPGLPVPGSGEPGDTGDTGNPGKRGGGHTAAGGFFSESMPYGPLAGGGTPLTVHPGERVSVESKITSTPNINVNMDPLGVRKHWRQFISDVTGEIASGVRQGNHPLVLALQQRLGNQLNRRV